MTTHRPLSLNIRPCVVFQSQVFLSPKLLTVQALSLLYPVKGISKEGKESWETL